MTPHPFAQYIKILGRGKKSSRSLSFEEARDAMTLILQGGVSAEQIGAFLMLLRVKEESPEEIAAFVTSIRQQLPPEAKQICVDLDWSSYSGKRAQQPWFLLVVFALANSGTRILMHGSDGHTQNRVYTSHLLEQLGIAQAASWEQVTTQLDKTNFSFLHLKNLNPVLQELISLKHLLGLRSPVNTLVRLINPCTADYSISSVFHPAYGPIQQRAHALLKQKHFSVFKGEGGEIECRPEADLKMLRLIDNQATEKSWPRLQSYKSTSQAPLSLENACQKLTEIWHSDNSINVNSLSKLEDPLIESHTYALRAIAQTLSACVNLLNPELSLLESQQRAEQIWLQRKKQFI